ncbi:hypothetical protein QTA57_16520 [Fontisubflavum oceani]|uniref:hypothetical protein n=1 Tax=Fontisubflavum oceani TaxID=2978973 RepID=UPI0025B5ED80|nr:hypothetical protein [Fontisubflavum oceani]WJY21343.1 hypothetical protein QTA57_16520 [Fontisubflavum oceani]
MKFALSILMIFVLVSCSFESQTPRVQIQDGLAIDDDIQCASPLERPDLFEFGTLVIGELSFDNSRYMIHFESEERRLTIDDLQLGCSVSLVSQYFDTPPRRPAMATIDDRTSPYWAEIDRRFNSLYDECERHNYSPRPRVDTSAIDAITYSRCGLFVDQNILEIGIGSHPNVITVYGLFGHLYIWKPQE